MWRVALIVVVSGCWKGSAPPPLAAHPANAERAEPLNVAEGALAAIGDGEELPGYLETFHVLRIDSEYHLHASYTGRLDLQDGTTESVLDATLDEHFQPVSGTLTTIDHPVGAPDIKHRRDVGTNQWDVATIMASYLVGVCHDPSRTSVPLRMDEYDRSRTITLREIVIPGNTYRTFAVCEGEALVGKLEGSRRWGKRGDKALLFALLGFDS